MKIEQACLLGLLLAACCLPVSADVHRVPSEYPTISAAIEAAAQSDTVLVAPGTYVETVRIDKFLSLISEAGAGVTTIDAGGAYEDVVWVRSGLMGHGDQWLVEGFTITNGHVGVAMSPDLAVFAVILRACIVCDNTGTGVSVYHGRPSIEGCTIAGNAGSGIFLSETGMPALVTGNLIMDKGGAGFSAYIDFSGFVLMHNTVVGNAWGLHVARWHAGAVAAISSNIIAQNGSYGIWVRQFSPPFDCSEIRYNDIWGHGEDVQSGSDCADYITGYNGNVSAAPLFCASGASDFTLSQDSPCVGTGEDGTDMGAFGIGCGPQTGVPEDSQTATSRLRGANSRPCSDGLMSGACVAAAQLAHAANGLACHASCMCTWRARLAPAADARFVTCHRRSRRHLVA